MEFAGRFALDPVVLLPLVLLCRYELFLVIGRRLTVVQVRFCHRWNPWLPGL